MILFQILAAILITTLVSQAFIRSAKDEINQNLADQTANELILIAEAAQQYLLDNEKWPDQVNECGNNTQSALQELLNENFLFGVSKTVPFYKTVPNHKFYRTNCKKTSNKSDKLLFSIKTDLPTELFAKYVESKVKIKFADTEITSKNNARFVVKLHTPRPVEDTLHEKFLALGDTSANSNMYQGKGNGIEDVTDVVLTDGRKFSDIHFIDILTIKITSGIGSVNKPVCVTNQTARVHLAPGPNFVDSNNKPIYGWNIYITTNNANNWIFTASTLTEDGSGTPRDDSFVVAQTYCENNIS